MSRSARRPESRRHRVDVRPVPATNATPAETADSAFLRSWLARQALRHAMLLANIAASTRPADGPGRSGGRAAV